MRVLSFLVIVALVVSLVPQVASAAPKKRTKRVLSKRAGRLPSGKSPAGKALRRTFGKVPATTMKKLASGKTLLLSVKNPALLRGFGFVTMKGSKLLVSLREGKFLVRNPKSANKGLLLRNLKKGGKIAIDGVPVERTGRGGFVMAEAGGGGVGPRPPIPGPGPIGKVRGGVSRGGVRGAEAGGGVAPIPVPLPLPIKPAMGR